MTAIPIGSTRTRRSASPAPALPTSEMRRFLGSPRAVLALLALVLVPLVVGGLYTWANESPLARVDQLTAAVVNLDEPVTLTLADGSTQLAPLGRSVVGSLTSSSEASNYSWFLTDAPTAADGLANGRFAAVLTIPADFSRAATSTSGVPADARAARLTVTTNDAVNYLDGAIAKAIATATSAEAARTITEGHLQALYAGLGSVRSSLSEASAGATSLAGGAKDLSSGADKAETGAGALASGADQLSSGAREFASGADQLAAGADKAATGAGSLDAGLRTLDQQVGALPGQTRQLADGAGALASGVEPLVSGSSALSSGVSTVADSASPLATGASAASSDAADLNAGIAAYTQEVDGLAATCAASGGTPAFCADLTTIAGQGAGLRADATQLAGGASEVAGGLTQLSGSLPALVDGATGVAGGLAALRPGAAQLAEGTDQLANGMPLLAGGVRSAATGALQLADNLTVMGSGARGLADGAEELAGGASRTADGAAELSTGVASIATGSNSLATGAQELSTGLGLGVSKLPTSTADEQQRIAAVAAAPVLAEATRLNAVPNHGSGLAPFPMALALWVGGFASFLLLRPLAPRALASSAPSTLVALEGFFPAALLATVQGAALVLVLRFGMGVGSGSLWPLVGVTILVAMAFAAINQALVALMGALGRLVAVLLAGLQLAAAGGTYPVDTAPGLFQALHAWLPLTYAVEALRATIAGSSVGLGNNLAALVVTMLLALACSIYAARRRRTWTIRRLRPTVAA
ncbi:MAG: YhgE/Pip domain-containing protein [Actinomycetales bacterium]|nr:YhgE/Pip domain-containing protein [Actinomycetales bacterium]